MFKLILLQSSAQEKSSLQNNLSSRLFKFIIIRKAELRKTCVNKEKKIVEFWVKEKVNCQNL